MVCILIEHIVRYIALDKKIQTKSGKKSLQIRFNQIQYPRCKKCHTDRECNLIQFRFNRYITSKDIAIHNREGKINIYESNPWEDKGKIHVPPNRRIWKPNLLARFTPYPEHESMRANLETPPQQCPSIPTVLLLPHTYSTMFITTRQFYFSRLLLPHTQPAVFITARELRNPFLHSWQCPASSHMLYIHFLCPGLFPPLGIFTAFLIPDFQGLPVAKSLIFHL
jgi:hypothetical protein